MSEQDPWAGGSAEPPGDAEHAEFAEFAEQAEHAEFAEFAEQAEHAEFAEFAEHAEHAEHVMQEVGAEQEAAAHHRLHHLLGRTADGQPDLVWRAEVLHMLQTANRLQAASLSRLHRQDKPEPRWPVSAAVIVAIVLQSLLPAQLALRPTWLHDLLFALEGALLIALFAANPIRIERMSRPIRSASVVLIFLISAANAASAVSLVRAIVTNSLTLSAQHAAVDLFLSGAAIWGTNVIAFALWYWEFDRGGPVSRLEGSSQYPDLLWTQMTEPALTRPGWGPQFADYLYFSFTNATAFSPTDVMPLARWAKLTMMVQAAVSLVLGILVIARAVGILPLK